jgi:hypothetical protein
MKINYNVTGKDRRLLADEIGKALCTVPRYLKLPTYAYQIGECYLDKNGVLDIPNLADKEKITEHLRAVGYEGFEAVENLVIHIPKDTFTETALANLRQLIENNSVLIKKAFKIENLELAVDDENVAFPWFPEIDDADEVSAYTEFVSKLCEMARVRKRVSNKPVKTSNDKYTFRCFLLRLGFIGKEYKNTRKVLLKNLTGNSAFRN